MTALHAYLNGIGLLGPGLADWPSAEAVLRGDTPYVARETVLPAPIGLPPAERRRTSTIVKLALAVGYEASARADLDPKLLPAVFTSSGGDGHNCHEICQTLASDDRQLSPTRFHNSVHNAAAGYWSIATGATPASTSLCAFDASFAAGLLEALSLLHTDNTPVLLVAYDAGYPQPIHAVRPIPAAFGLALVLAPEPGSTALAQLAVALSDEEPQRLCDPALETLRTEIPAARGLTLLERLARRHWGRAQLEYLGGQSVSVEVAPCL